ncbi:hypothetical protein CPter91_4357 [Collimonas pratensis]|uniref:Uncharacterized protein n=1 Tax=Collimonas pratensis TaxID=279113 RepID=A0A127Q9D9_9BURK|nr:hypothetical protein CPter91_4357 [Collimonas pratensis]
MPPGAIYGNRLRHLAAQPEVEADISFHRLQLAIDSDLYHI